MSPLDWLYGSGAALRNALYDRGWLRSFGFDFPVIGVGNLSVGGTGKTPMVDFLISMLDGQFRVATLSRGYGRHSKGYLLAGDKPDAATLGDEPAWLKKRHPEVEVAVGERRVPALAALLQDAPEVDVVLLDDAFQHRAIIPGLNILLTSWYRPFSRDCPLPGGRLREFRSGAARADLVVVTKSNETSPEDREQLRQEIRAYLKPDTPVFFSDLEYQPEVQLHLPPLNSSSTYAEPERPYLVTGIADAEPLKEFAKGRWELTGGKDFSDHHRFTERQCKALFREAEELGADALLMTEKDAMRWSVPGALPVFTQGVNMRMSKDDRGDFERIILEYIRKAELSRPDNATSGNDA